MCARLHLPSHHFCYGNSHLPLWSIVRRQLITSDAKSASAVQIDAVQAEFAKTGIPAEVSQKLVKQYKPYLNWDIETKLRPALQSWLQELGTEQLSQQLQKSRHLLLRKPDNCIRVSLWLSSMGVDAGRVQRKAPQVMLRELLSVQQLFEALQQAAAFSDAQMCTFLHRHPAAFASEPDRVLHSLEVVSMLLDMPMTSDNFKETVLTASERLFLMSPGALHQHVAFFCQLYGTGIHVARTAITAGVFVTPESVMQARAAKLQEQLGWDSEQLKQKLSAFPNILNSELATIAHNVRAMQGAGFSLIQVWAMCTQHPALLCRNWTSDTSVEKLQFLTCLLGLTLDDIAARPKLLACSVSGYLGP